MKIKFITILMVLLISNALIKSLEVTGPGGYEQLLANFKKAMNDVDFIVITGVGDLEKAREIALPLYKEIRDNVFKDIETKTVREFLIKKNLLSLEYLYHPFNVIHACSDFAKKFEASAGNLAI